MRIPIALLLVISAAGCGHYPSTQGALALPVRVAFAEDRIEFVAIKAEHELQLARYEAASEARAQIGMIGFGMDDIERSSKLATRVTEVYRGTQAPPLPDPPRDETWATALQALDIMLTPDRRSLLVTHRDAARELRAWQEALYTNDRTMHMVPAGSVPIVPAERQSVECVLAWLEACGGTVVDKRPARWRG